jgi:deoxyxylulose-5-phosphate synthase
VAILGRAAFAIAGGWYAHIPGLVVAVPSTPQDNFSMMKAAIEADDPVVYLEHKNIWANEGEVDEAEPYVWGTARVRRTGRRRHHRQLVRLRQPGGGGGGPWRPRASRRR